jgi:hypothetical protein
MANDKAAEKGELKILQANLNRSARAHDLPEKNI